MRHVDVIVIGAGTAGLSACKELQRQGAEFLLMDRGPLGTTCARVGCMPSKTLIEVANQHVSARRYEKLGIFTGRHEIDIPAAMRHVRALRDHFVAGVMQEMKQFSDRFIEGHARLVDPHTVEVGGTRYRADHIILATGSRPVTPKGFEPFSDISVTSDDLFELENLPARIGVIGGGILGIEAACALSHLGCEVTVFHRGRMIAGLADPAINNAAIEQFNGLTLRLKASPAPTRIGNAVRLQDGDFTTDVDLLLYAAGRTANIDDIGLENCGLDPKSAIKQYDFLTQRIGDAPLYLIGDADQCRAVVHEASDEARRAVRHALGIDTSADTRMVPLRITFTDPAIAQVGQNWKDLDGTDFLVGEASFDNQGKARIMQSLGGMARLYADRQGHLLGAEMVAPHADHLAHWLAVMIDRKMTVDGILAQPIYHPTLEEGLKPALRSLSKQLNRNKETSV